MFRRLDLTQVDGFEAVDDPGVYLVEAVVHFRSEPTDLLHHPSRQADPNRDHRQDYTSIAVHAASAQHPAASVPCRAEALALPAEPTVGGFEAFAAAFGLVAAGLDLVRSRGVAEGHGALRASGGESEHTRLEVDARRTPVQPQAPAMKSALFSFTLILLLLNAGEGPESLPGAVARRGRSCVQGPAHAPLIVQAGFGVGSKYPRGRITLQARAGGMIADQAAPSAKLTVLDAKTGAPVALKACVTRSVGPSCNALESIGLMKVIFSGTDRLGEQLYRGSSVQQKGRVDF